ncbi:MAG: NYN domain-containing protein [Planctomycetia bacterium]|nr:NYN domain-containing protein [Planctomycetia bacterium]
MPTSSRVICYIDGFNLYFGMRAANFRRYYWLDLCGLSASFLRPTQQLSAVKYFTARISGARPGDTPKVQAEKNAKRTRQQVYLEALSTLPLLTMFEGHYLDKTTNCRKCGAQWFRAEEKMTDVQIATELLTDAFQDKFDTAFVVSADSDLAPPIRRVLALFPSKRVVVAFPPKRSSVQLTKTATTTFIIGKPKLAANQLPNPVATASGHQLARPAEWK